MGKINTYETDGTPSLADKILGTESSSDNATKNYLLSDVKALMFQTFGVNRVLNGFSTANQLPVGLDTPLQVAFGAAQFTSSDPVMIDAAGTVTFNQPGLYLLNAYGTVERKGSSGGSAVVLFRSLINDVQAGSTKGFELNTVDIIIPYEVTIPLQIDTVGTTLKFQIMRDSSGFDAGGLYIHENLGGWSDVPSAEISLWRIGG
jgi:hypothetical protein